MGSADIGQLLQILGAGSILLLILISLALCRKKNFENVFIHAFLQFVGVLGLVVMGGFAYIFGPIYLAASVLINGFGKKDNKINLRTSPIFTLLGFALLIGFPQLEAVALFSQINAFTKPLWWIYLASIVVFYILLVLSQKSEWLINRCQAYKRFLPVVSGALILLPWFFYAASVCVAQNFSYKYTACVIGPDPFSGGIVLAGVFLGLLFCRHQRIKRFEIHVLLQLAGVVGLLGFRTISSVPSFIYALSLIVLYSDEDSTENWLASPIYTIIYIAILFAISETAEKIALIRRPHYLLTLSWRVLFPKKGPELWFFYLPLATLIIGLIALYVRSKTRSVVAAFIVALPLGLIAFYWLLRLTFRGALSFS